MTTKTTDQLPARRRLMVRALDGHHLENCPASPERAEAISHPGITVVRCQDCGSQVEIRGGLR